MRPGARENRLRKSPHRAGRGVTGGRWTPPYGRGSRKPIRDYDAYEFTHQPIRRKSARKQHLPARIEAAGAATRFPAAKKHCTRCEPDRSGA